MILPPKATILLLLSVVLMENFILWRSQIFFICRSSSLWSALLSLCIWVLHSGQRDKDSHRYCSGRAVDGDKDISLFCRQILYVWPNVYSKRLTDFPDVSVMGTKQNLISSKTWWGNSRKPLYETLHLKKTTCIFQVMFGFFLHQACLTEREDRPVLAHRSDFRLQSLAPTNTASSDNTGGNLSDFTQLPFGATKAFIFLFSPQHLYTDFDV